MTPCGLDINFSQEVKSTEWDAATFLPAQDMQEHRHGNGNETNQKEGIQKIECHSF